MKCLKENNLFVSFRSLCALRNLRYAESTKFSVFLDKKLSRIGIRPEFTKRDIL